MNNLLNKYKIISTPAKAALWFTICNLLVKGISFISVPIFTGMMTDDEYGILSIFMSYEQVILIIATWEIQLGAYQKGLFNYKDDQRLFTSATQALINILTIVFFSIMFIFNSLLTKVTGMSIHILLLLFVYLLLQPSYSCWLARKRTVYDYKSAVIVTLIYSIINVVVPMVALVVVDKTADIKFSFTLFASAIVCIFFYIPNANYISLARYWDKVKEIWKFLIHFEAPLVLHSLSYLVLSQADRIMIGSMVGNAQAAYYSVAYNLANVIGILQTSLNQSLLPWRYEMLEKKNYKRISDVSNYLLVAVGVVIFMFVLISPEIMKIFFTASYYEAIWCIPPIAVSVYFMFLYTIFVNIETYYEKTQYVMYVSVSCGIINVFLNYVCIQIWGYIACGYTTMVSYILFSVGHYFFMKHVLKKEADGVQVVDIRMILLISVLVVVLSVISTVLYPLTIVRYVILVAICIVSLAFRKRIMMFVKSIRAKN